MSAPKVGAWSRWGRIDYVDQLAEGVWFCGTASHGAIKLDRKRNALVPVGLRVVGGWYEEDCEYAVAMHFAGPEAERAKHAEGVQRVREYVARDGRMYSGELAR